MFSSFCFFAVMSMVVPLRQPTPAINIRLRNVFRNSNNILLNKTNILNISDMSVLLCECMCVSVCLLFICLKSMNIFSNRIFHYNNFKIISCGMLILIFFFDGNQNFLVRRMRLFIYLFICVFHLTFLNFISS